MPECQQVTGTQSHTRAVASNASPQGISRPAVPLFNETPQEDVIPEKLPPASFGTKAQHAFPIQRKGGKLTFTELSIYSPGNSATFAEVTLDGQSLDKWNNKEDASPDNEEENQHAEHKMVDDLTGKYLDRLKAAKVLSLTINRAPCESCAERLVKLKKDYNIQIRVKATIITEKGLKGLPVLAAADIPFRIFTIAQREAIGNNKRKSNRKRVWGKGNRYFTEEQRVAKTAEGNDRDLKTASKDLSTDTGRALEEQANLKKAQDYYPNAHLSWKAQGKSTAALSSLSGGGRTADTGGISGPQPYPNSTFTQQDEVKYTGSRLKPFHIDESEEEEDEDETSGPVRSKYFSNAPSSSREKEEEEPTPVRSKYFNNTQSSSGERSKAIPSFLRNYRTNRNSEPEQREEEPQKKVSEPKRQKTAPEPQNTDLFFTITMEEEEDDQGWIEHEVSEIKALAARFGSVETEFSPGSVTFIVSASEYDNAVYELQHSYSYRASITGDKP